MLEIKLVLHSDGKVSVNTPGSREIYPTRTFTNLGRACGLIGEIGAKHDKQLAEERRLARQKVAV
jgi:hypothetical protein